MLFSSLLSGSRHPPNSMKPCRIWRLQYANDGDMSAVISAKLKLPAKDTCVSINTPRMKCPQDEVDAQEGTALTKDSVQALWTVESEAQKYLRGDRAQMKLFGDNGEPNAQGA